MLTRNRPHLLHAAVVGLAIAAFCLERRMNNEIEIMGSSIEHANELEKDAWNEVQLAQANMRDALIVDDQAAIMQNEAAALEEQSRLDAAKAAFEELIGEELEEWAEKIKNEAAQHFGIASTNEERFNNFTKSAKSDEEEATRLEKELKKHSFDLWVCENAKFLCHTLGGGATVGLKEKATEAAAQAAREYAAAEKVKPLTLFERNVGMALDESAADLSHGIIEQILSDAKTLEQRARSEDAQATRENAVANREHAEASQKAMEALYEEGKAANDKEEAKSLRAQAIGHAISAYGYAIASCILAGPVLGFVLAVIAKSILRVDYQTQMKQIRYGGLWEVALKYEHRRFEIHIYIVLLAIGFVGSCLTELTSYDMKDRGAIVLYISFLAALMEATFLQALPHAYAVAEFGVQAIKDVALNFSKRFLTLLVRCLIDFLIVWVMLRKAPFWNAFVAFVGSWIFRLGFAIVLVIFLRLHEFRGESHQQTQESVDSAREPVEDPVDRSDTHVRSQEGSDQEKSQPSEVSSLVTVEFRSVSTDYSSLPFVILPRSAPEENGSAVQEIETPPRFDVSWNDELRNLVPPFQVLAACLMAAVIWHCIATAIAICGVLEDLN